MQGATLKQSPRGHRRKATRRWIRATTQYATVILGGAIAARLVMMTIDLIAARHGNPPGGEIFLPFYAILLPAIGWQLRGAWAKATTASEPKIRKEQLQ